MNCASCSAPLELATSGSVAKCSSCQGWYGIMNGAPVAIAVSVPWAARSREQERDDAEERAEGATAGPANPAGKILRIAVPLVIVVVMAVVGLSIYLSAQPSAPAAKPPAAAPPPAAKKK